MPSPPEFNVEGKVFIAVGAGRGIGRGIVEVLADAGAEGAVTALTPVYVMPLAERVAQHSGRRITGIVADGTSGNAMDGVVERVLRDYGRIDVWINTLGDAIRSPLVPLPRADGSRASGEPLSDEDVRRIMDINLTTIIVGSRSIGRYFLERRQGKIINIGSFAGKRGGAYMALYAAAKAGVEGLTRALALEWAPFGVTVNCISPGSFPDTEVASAEALAQSRERTKSTVPLGRPGEVREVGLLALYLASDASAYMTGQSINLDGGMTL